MFDSCMILKQITRKTVDLFGFEELEQKLNVNDINPTSLNPFRMFNICRILGYFMNLNFLAAKSKPIDDGVIEPLVFAYTGYRPIKYAGTRLATGSRLPTFPKQIDIKGQFKQ